MENKAIAKTLRLLSQLMELHNENPFKIRSITNAAFKIDKLPFAIAKKSLEEMERVEGLGKSISLKIWELLHNSSIKEMDALLLQTPTGIVEMLQLKGIGPKKIVVIWQDLAIETVGELYYACNENRLIEAKGFGLKTQDEIKKVIEFKMASLGRFLYARVEGFADSFIQKLQNIWQNDNISFTGAYRRRCEIIDSLDVLVGLPITDKTKLELTTSGIIISAQKENTFECVNEEGLKINISFCSSSDYGLQLLIQTGNNTHVQKLESLLSEKSTIGKNEKEIYSLAGLQFIEPELREGLEEIEKSKNNRLPELIKLNDLKGTLHNHSTWSDGVHTLEEMAVFCRDELKLEYLGISDHSKSAFYAKGLNEVRVAAQQREIDDLNVKLSPFKIFKGIESDILFDGSLDYSNEILATFDFVVASIHSILNMNEDKATDRLIKAIENPFTTILGHPTGRMLLARSGYPINHKKVIEACAANNVVIEINSNPLRLDLDWRWHNYAIEKGVILSINPDAHRISGFQDMHYGTLIARKGGVSKADCLNAMGLEQITAYFQKKRTLLLSS